tara:strand:- start:150 stop:470 length:321 start_codon:yes stop_codon:yes gene_type:complete
MNLEAPISITLNTVEEVLYLRTFLNIQPSDPRIAELLRDYPGGHESVIQHRREGSLNKTDMFMHIRTELERQGLPSDVDGLAQHLTLTAPDNLNGYEVHYHPGTTA